MSRGKSKPEIGMYWCSGCLSLVCKDGFYKVPSRSTGISSRCKPCSSKAAVFWKALNPDKAAVANTKYINTAKAKEQRKKWEQGNRDHLNAYMREWRKTHSFTPTKGIRPTSSRAMPPWADKKSIAAVYAEAKALREQTGLDWQVDHVIPLNGETVSGLHVTANLRVVLASENRNKRNKFEDANQ